MAYSSWTEMPPSKFEFTRPLSEIATIWKVRCTQSKLGLGYFWTNYLINGALGHGGEQPVALLVLGKTRFALITVIFNFSVLCLIPSLWHYLDSVGFRSGQFAGQLSTVTPLSKFLIFGRCQIELDMISISTKFVNIMKHNVI